MTDVITAAEFAEDGLRRMKRAGIAAPSICRMVVVSRMDGAQFALGGPGQTALLVSEAPATVIGVERDDDLSIVVTIGAYWYRAPHRDLVPVGWPGDMLVWHWPPRT